MNRVRAILSRLRAMSPRERGLIVVCLLFGAGIAVVKGLILPVYAGYERDLAAIRQRVATIDRYDASRKNQDRVDEERVRLEEQLVKWEKGLLTGESASAAGVFLQGLLKPLTQRPETQVMAIRALPPVKKGAYTEIAVQLDLQTSTEDLARILSDISRQPRYLRVRKFSASTGTYPGRPLPRKETATVSMVVFGLSAAPFDDKAAAGGGKP